MYARIQLLITGVSLLPYWAIMRAANINPWYVSWATMMIVSVGFMVGSMVYAQQHSEPQERRRALIEVPEAVATRMELMNIDRRVEILEALKLDVRLTRMELLFEQSAKAAEQSARAAEATRAMLVGIATTIGLGVLGWAVKFLMSAFARLKLIVPPN